MNIPTIKLNTGATMPQLGLGTWKAEPNQVGEAVEHALTQAQYNHVDCAAIYLNEPEIGEVFSSIFTSGKRKRDDIFITSKLWNTEHHAKDVRPACEQTLKDLQLDYLDLYLVHWGVAFKKDTEETTVDQVPLHETWQAMEELVKAGLVKAIGVSNFTCPLLLDVLGYAKIQPAVNQIELHPYLQQQALLDFCAANEIAVTAYSPLGRPGMFEDQEMPNLLEDNSIVTIAKNHKKTPAQIILRWAVQRGTIVIPKSVTPKRIEENIDIFDFELTAEEMEVIMNLDKHFRFVSAQWWPFPYFS